MFYIVCVLYTFHKHIYRYYIPYKLCSFILCPYENVFVYKNIQENMRIFFVFPLELCLSNRSYWIDKVHLVLLSHHHLIVIISYMILTFCRQIPASVLGSRRESLGGGACADLHVVGAELQGQGEESGYHGLL